MCALPARYVMFFVLIKSFFEENPTRGVDSSNEFVKLVISSILFLFFTWES
jgi:hypothetical protein